MTKNALQQFLDRYKKLKEDQELRPGKDILTTEFHKIKRESEKLGIDGVTIATVGAKEINRKKNRYKDILPFDHSRVILQRKDGQDTGDYINANYIMSPGGRQGYIASQAPMPSTVNDFWQMIWQHKVKIIVMACKEIELGKHRCQRYWPMEGEQLNFFDSIRVTLVKEVAITESLCERTIRAVDGKKQLDLTQLHYTAWPDHGVPKTTKDLIHMIEEMRERHPWDDPPVLIHCSAGCGRTGVMIAADYGRRLIRKSVETIDIYEVVMTLRRQRPAMVQSKEQYEYLHDVFKDLIEAQLRKSASPVSPSSYMNVDFGGSNTDTPVYENIEVISKFSPVPRPRKSSPHNDDIKSFMRLEKAPEPRKPMITNAVPSPQMARMNSDPFVAKPQPNRRPAVNLMDNDLPPSSDSHLQSPLLPTPSQPSPSQTNGVKKPNSNAILFTQEAEVRKLQPEKDSSSSNYVNFQIGSPKVSSRPEKPKSPTKRSEVNAEKPKIPIKPSSVSSSSNDAPKQSSVPRLPIKSKPRIEDSPNDAIDGSRPTLPLKQKDLCEFDSIFSSKPKEGSNGKENFKSMPSNNVLPVANKARTFGRESSESKAERLDLWKNYSPDYEVASAGPSTRVPDADYAVLDLSSKKNRNHGKDQASQESIKPTSGESSESKAERLDLWKKYSPDYEVASAGPSTRVPDADYAVVDFSSKKNSNHGKDQAPQESIKPMALQQKASGDLLLGRTSGNDKKMASSEDIFAPFEPSSSIRVSPTPKATGKTGLPISRNIPSGIKQTVDRTNQGSMASDANEFRKRDGLVRRTNQSINRNEKKNDPQAAKANYVVSIQKTNADGTNDVKRAPLPHQPHSWETLVGDRDKKETGQPRRFLSQDTKHYPSDNISDMADSFDSGYQYVQTRKPIAEEESAYETIYPVMSPNAIKPTNPQLSPTKPPLPPRTPESFMIIGDDDSQAEDIQDASSTDKSNDQASWLSASVDKVKKLTNFKVAFSSGMKQIIRPGSHTDLTTSSFYTPTPPTKEFPLRIQQKPRGPRNMPGHWMP